MGSQRLSLSSSVFDGRIRKYDTYVRRPSEVARPKRADIKNPASTQSSASPIQPKVSSAPSSITLKQESKLAPRLRTTSENPKVSAQVSRGSQNYTRQLNPNASAKHLAMQTVAKSAPSLNQDGTIAQQFSDENEVVYATGKRSLTKLQKAMYGLGVLVFMFAGFSSIQTIFTNKQAQEQIATLGARTDEQGVSEGTGSEPSESDVSQSAIAAYQASNPEDPRYLRIPSLGVFSRVKNLGIDSKGAVDAPWNINDSGWYNGSARPGSSVGSSLILGHVSGWTAPGVFKNIKNLKPGAQFEIEKGSGEKIQYEVVRSESLPVDQVDMSKILGTVEAGKHDLKLMTCAGKYNRETKTYEDRLVVYAKPIN